MLVWDLRIELRSLMKWTLGSELLWAIKHRILKSIMFRHNTKVLESSRVKLTWDQICVAVAHTYLLDIIQSRVISAELWYLDYLGMKKMRRDNRANANISNRSSGTPLTQFLWLGLQVANVPVRLWRTACNRLTVTWPDNRYRRVTGTHGIYHQPRWYTKMIYIYNICIYRYTYINTDLTPPEKKLKQMIEKQQSVYIIAACYLNIKIITKSVLRLEIINNESYNIK